MKAQTAWGRSWRAGVWLLLACGLPMRVCAWGAQGHEVIARLAQGQLSAKANAEVGRLLALEPGATLESISTWADEHRNPASAPWHYVNFPRGSCTFNAQRDCPDGKCVVAAIERQLAIVGGHGPDEQRLHALKYLVHLVGDVHQPLHAGYRDDKGGNTYQLRAFMRGSNLHSVWDSGLIGLRHEDTADMAARLHKGVVPNATKSQSPTKAAEESCRMVATPGFYPDGFVDLSYIQRFTPWMEQRLATAAARLAAMLNHVFL